MSDVRVAMHALHRVGVGLGALHYLMNEISMTTQTVILKDFGIVRLNANRLVKILKRKTLGMVIAVRSFGNIFSDQIVRKVAIDAHGGGMVRTFLPRGELVIHDMAIGARLRIGGKIGKAVCIGKRKDANAGQKAKKRGQKENRF
jgi:hypothetical protein